MASIWHSWNPITGCVKYSDGCKNCYAKGMAEKFQKLGVPKYKNGFAIVFHKNALNFPSKLKRPSIIFPNSMTDLFQEGVDFEDLKKVFDVMNKNDKHLYFVLTKRTERLLELSQKLEIGEHIWIGTTIESEKYAYRLNYLKKVKAKHKWINIEPILSDFTKLDLAGIERVCGGTENGPLAREAKYEWVENLAEQCKEQKVPFAFKFRKGSKIKASLEKPNFHGKPNILREFERKSLEGNLKQTSLF